MITTTFLLLLISFELWYLTSKQFKPASTPVFVTQIIAHAQMYRIFAALLFVAATVSFILLLGVASGISAVVFGLMAAGSLIVVIQPFQYIHVLTVAILYISILLLEVFI